MGRISDPNVVRYWGESTAPDETRCLVLEYCDGGDLQSRLYKKPNVPVGADKALNDDERLRFGLQAALGVECLHKNDLVHRDIAARNVLLRREEGALRAKIADLGMTRELQKDDGGGDGVYAPKSRSARPIRWIAPEILHEGTFSARSDVYAFGMLLFEIWHSSRPWPRIDDYRKIEQKLLDGKKHPDPTKGPEAVQTLVCDGCWVASAQRLTMAEIVTALQSVRVQDEYGSNVEVEEYGSDVKL